MLMFATICERGTVGYHWVRVDDRYMLATVAGGLIADVIMASQYGR
jgi:Ni/Co efflux regulator RcnB